MQKLLTVVVWFLSLYLGDYLYYSVNGHSLLHPAKVEAK
jgi:hypothetical protein